MTAPRSLNDEALMERVAARDSSALAELYDRHAPVILALCVRVLRNRMEAEEVLGDVFFEVWNRHERYSAARGTALAYLTTLARSRAVDRLRSRRERDRRTVAAGDAPEADTQARAGGASPTALEGLVAEEQRQRVLEAVSGLTPSQRQAVELAFYEGLSHSEIAARLGEPLGTVKTRIRQGLIQMRASLLKAYDARA